MTEKTDMIQRQKDMLDQLNNDTFNKHAFMDKHHILDRTLRRDLNALAQRGEIFEERLGYLRKKCLGNLTQKVHDGKLSPSLMFNIVMSGVTHKAEIKTNITKMEEVNVTVKLRDYAESIRRAVERDFSRHNNKQPIHPEKTSSNNR